MALRNCNALADALPKLASPSSSGGLARATKRASPCFGASARRESPLSGLSDQRRLAARSAGAPCSAPRSAAKHGGEAQVRPDAVAATRMSRASGPNCHAWARMVHRRWLAQRAQRAKRGPNVAPFTTRALAGARAVRAECAPAARSLAQVKRKQGATRCGGARRWLAERCADERRACSVGSASPNARDVALRCNISSGRGATMRWASRSAWSPTVAATRLYSTQLHAAERTGGVRLRDNKLHQRWRVNTTPTHPRDNAYGSDRIEQTNNKP